MISHLARRAASSDGIAGCSLQLGLVVCCFEVPLPGLGIKQPHTTHPGRAGAMISGFCPLDLSVPFGRIFGAIPACKVGRRKWPWSTRAGKVWERIRPFFDSFDWNWKNTPIELKGLYSHYSPYSWHFVYCILYVVLRQQREAELTSRFRLGQTLTQEEKSELCTWAELKQLHPGAGAGIAQ